MIHVDVFVLQKLALQLHAMASIENAARGMLLSVQAFLALVRLHRLLSILQGEAVAQERFQVCAHRLPPVGERAKIFLGILSRLIVIHNLRELESRHLSR